MAFCPGAINQLMGRLTKCLRITANQPKKVIAMLRELVAAHQYVIKRIAWQINEPNIIELLKALNLTTAPR